MLENVYILPLTFRHMIQLHFIAHVHGTTVLLVSEVYYKNYWHILQSVAIHGTLF